MSEIKYKRMNYFYPCYIAYVEDVDVDIVIAKLNGVWKLGIYKENIDDQPHPHRDGWVGNYMTLRKAKEVAGINIFNKKYPSLNI